MDQELRLRKIENLIALTYWKNMKHCGGGFDEVLCKDVCPHHEFCFLWQELRNED